MRRARYGSAASGVLTTLPEWDDAFTSVSTASTPVQDVDVYLTMNGTTLADMIAYLNPSTIEVTNAPAIYTARMRGLAAC